MKKYYVEIQYPNGQKSSLSHKGKASWSKSTAYRYLAQWKKAHGTGHKVKGRVVSCD